MIVTHYVNCDNETELKQRVRNMSRTELELAYIVLAMDLVARQSVEKDFEKVYLDYVLVKEDLYKIYVPWYDWWPARLARLLCKFIPFCPSRAAQQHPRHLSKFAK